MSRNTISEVIKLKRRLYIELLRLVKTGKLVEEISNLSQKMITKESPRYRCCEFKERAIFDQRIKAVMGFNIASNKDKSLEELAESLPRQEKKRNIVEVIDTACDSCPIDKYIVTDACRNCVAHKCVNACPVNAIVIIQNKAYIDQDKCVECGKCAGACSYNAILENQRPCSRACELDAISSDSNRQAKIDREKCVSCGSCITACPFGAITETGDLIQVALELFSEKNSLAAMLAPSFVGQFGYQQSPAKIKYALKKLGFEEVREVAAGAEITAAAESKELKEKIMEEKTLLSSCCPAFKRMVLNEFESLSCLISNTDSPMAVTAKKIKNENNKLKTIFIGPCTAKKEEALQNENVDYVITFEELLALFTAHNINLAAIEKGEKLEDAGVLGRQFAYAGGLQKSLQELVTDNYNSKQIDGLGRLKKELYLIKAKKNNYNFLEGMACVGGCIGGPSAMISEKAAKKLVQNFADSN
ncbi:ferredoxin hydrogenase large subunit [Halanaerobium saccharolyticum]|uniref:Ferredoxin hydrogenase large subunit n=1 Tax=Halanaerobium saccharolyticum TaxID=43595 RepID=A0A4R7YX07_9FIRM|nr:monomeric [FeFe] hydrogenase [Halanaerobium saccharolyticum]RAK07115.1 ferredoxin hydrogenase large subunit [Halanaerobium saccharolyticum]TDW01873.1 ferredoxin hydrogenase large subunit [Halanaerobium saccharolyticum]TDX53119.1 ferredoxin hydrogenase large subunit [Halanaerobium saccharolyticum]